MLRAITMLCAAALLHSDTRSADVGAALHAGEARITATSLGGHSGHCLRVEAENLTARPITLRIPTGWRFASLDSTLQDLLVVGDQVIALAPNMSGTVTCSAFCCEAGDASPAFANAFDQGRMADERLVKLAQHLAASSYPEHAMQQAVWTVSDDNPISAVDADDDAATLALRQYLSALTGRPVPWYTTAFAPPADGRAFDPTPTRITGRVEFQQRHAGVLSIVVKDADGRTLRVIDEGRDLRQGHYSIDVEVTVRGWPPGHYAICIAVDGVLLKREEFEV
ncbi:MAG: hypothetical protein IPK70_03785 [Flavobacteriales bacterium]|jgi:hypothetical protein|nr:hypothetical protein [Flavobacteriales bacterium]